MIAVTMVFVRFFGAGRRRNWGQLRPPWLRNYVRWDRDSNGKSGVFDNA